MRRTIVEGGILGEPLMKLVHRLDRLRLGAFVLAPPPRHLFQYQNLHRYVFIH